MATTKNMLDTCAKNHVDTGKESKTSNKVQCSIFTFGEFDCTGEHIEPSFLGGWPSLALKFPLGSPPKP